MPVIVATFTPKPDQLDQVENVLRELIPMVHEEDGCELYALHRGPDRLVFVENWRDSAALRAHSTGPSLVSLRERLEGLLAAPPDVQILEAVPAGDPNKGAV